MNSPFYSGLARLFETTGKQPAELRDLVPAIRGYVAEEWAAIVDDPRHKADIFYHGDRPDDARKIGDSAVSDLVAKALDGVQYSDEIERSYELATYAFNLTDSHDGMLSLGDAALRLASVKGEKSPYWFDRALEIYGDNEGRLFFAAETALNMATTEGEKSPYWFDRALEIYGDNEGRLFFAADTALANARNFSEDARYWFDRALQIYGDNEAKLNSAANSALTKVTGTDAQYWFRQSTGIYRKTNNAEGLVKTFDIALGIAEIDINSARPWLEECMEIVTDSYISSDDSRIQQLADLMLSMRISGGDVRSFDVSRMLGYLESSRGSDASSLPVDVVGTLTYLEGEIKGQRKNYFENHLPELLKQLGYTPIGETKRDVGKLREVVGRNIVPFTMSDYVKPLDSEFRVIKIGSEVSIYVLPRTRVTQLTEETVTKKKAGQIKTSIGPRKHGKDAMKELMDEAEAGSIF